MLVSDFFRILSFGPLSNIAAGSDGSGEVRVQDQGRVIEYTNSGLLRLYSRFLLSEKEVIIRMIEGITSYYLLAKFSEFSCTDEENLEEDLDPNQIQNETPRYIMDLLNPFEEDVIKVLQVRDSLGRELPLNDVENPLSIFTPSPNLLQVPRVMTNQALGVMYQAKHPRLELGVLTQKIELPETLHEALTYYVASKVYSAMNGQDNSAKGQEHMATFESICAEVQDRDLVNQSVSTTKGVFEMRGFV